jgi:hypothetical protein
MRLTHIRQLDVTEALASGNAFLSAASGLVCVGETYCMVADDEHHLALFNPADDGPGRLLRLLPGELPRKKKKRKAMKPDFEILFALPSSDGGQGDLLCALGSGSTAERMRGVLINLDSGIVASLDLKPLFEALALLVTEINLEGAAVRDDQLLLFNRGNMANPETHLFETAFSAISGHNVAPIRLVKTLALPMIEGVPLTVTDACSLDDGRFLLSAVAEVTDDSYADGAVLGAAIILLNADLDVVAIEPLEPIMKIEGISGRLKTSGAELLCVSDADDPDKPSSLYSATLAI